MINSNQKCQSGLKTGRDVGPRKKTGSVTGCKNSTYEGT